MNTLTRYVLGAQLRILLLTVTALGGVHLSLSVLDKLRSFLAKGLDLFTMVQYFAFGLPGIIAEITPFALLLATVLGLGGLSASAEITAMRAAGVSVFRVVAPLLMVGLLVSIISCWAGMGFIPHSNALAARVLTQGQGGETPGMSMSGGRVWFKAGENTLFGILGAAPDGQSMWGIRVLETDAQGHVTRMLQAERMEYVDNRWLMHSGRTLDAATSPMTLSHFKTHPAPLDRGPESLGEVRVPQRQLSQARLNTYVDRLKADGFATREYEMALAQRVAFPFAALIMVLVAIPHGLTPPRQHTLSKGIAVSLAIAVSFWFIHSLSLALGRAEVLPPLVAAWLPLTVFAAYGMNRLLAVRQ